MNDLMTLTRRLGNAPRASQTHGDSRDPERSPTVAELVRTLTSPSSQCAGSPEADKLPELPQRASASVLLHDPQMTRELEKPSSCTAALYFSVAFGL